MYSGHIVFTLGRNVYILITNETRYISKGNRRRLARGLVLSETKHVTANVVSLLNSALPLVSEVLDYDKTLNFQTMLQQVGALFPWLHV